MYIHIISNRRLSRFLNYQAIIMNDIWDCKYINLNLLIGSKFHTDASSVIRMIMVFDAENSFLV